MMRTGLVQALAGLWASVALAGPVYDERFCLVDVTDGAPTREDMGATWRMVGRVQMFPARIPPLIEPANRRGMWTIDASRRFVPYPEPFPSPGCATPGCWTTEPDSGRVIALQGYTRVGVLQAAPEEPRFTVIPGSEKIQAVSRPLSIKRLHGTLIGAYDEKVYMIRGDRVVEMPELATLGWAVKIADMPDLGAVLFVMDNRAQKDFLQLVARADGGAISHLGSIRRPDRFAGSGFTVLSKPDRVLVQRGEEDWVVRIGRSPSGLEAIAIDKLDGIGDPTRQFLESVGRHVRTGYTFGWTGDFPYLGWKLRIQHLTETGYRDVPGDTFKPSFPDIRGGVHFQDLPWRRMALATGKDGVYRYDGKSITRIPRSSPQSLGGTTFIYPLPALDKVLLVTGAGVFDFSREGSIRRLSVPFATGGYATAAAEMPASRIAFISAGDRSGIYTLDETDTIRLVPGSENESGNYDQFVGVIPVRNEMLYAGISGLHLLIDRNISGSSGCLQPGSARNPGNRRSTPAGSRLH